MTNKEWYLSLPNDLQDKIAANCNALNRKYRFAQWYDDTGNANITGAFSWDSTPERNDFWYSISQTLE
jgi:hypothetical protein